MKRTRKCIKYKLEQTEHSPCGLINFCDIPDNKLSRQCKTIRNFKKDHIIARKYNSKLAKLFLVNFHSSMSKQSEGPIDRDEYIDEYDNRILYDEFETYFKELIKEDVSNFTSINAPCLYCGLISRTIWLLTIGQRLPHYQLSDLIERDICPFGEFKLCGRKKLKMDSTITTWNPQLLEKQSNAMENSNSSKHSTESSTEDETDKMLFSKTNVHVHVVKEGIEGKKSTSNFPDYNSHNHELRCVRENSTILTFIVPKNNSIKQFDPYCRGVELTLFHLSRWLISFIENPIKCLTDIKFSEELWSKVGVKKIEDCCTEITDFDNSATYCPFCLDKICTLKQHYSLCAGFVTSFMKFIIISLKRLLNIHLKQPISKKIQDRVNSLWEFYLSTINCEFE